MNKDTLINYIKQNYPRIIFNPVKLSDTDVKENSLGIILSGTRLIVGYINGEGYVCKLTEPLNVKDLTNERFVEVINSIPIAKETGINKDSLLELLQNKTGVSEDEVTKLKKELLDKKADYDLLIDTSNNQTIMLKKEYSNKLDDIKVEYNAAGQKLRTELQMMANEHKIYKDKLCYEKGEIINNIKNFRRQVTDYIRDVISSNESSYTTLNNMYMKMVKEKTEIENSLKVFMEKEKENLNKMSQGSAETTGEIAQLNHTIKEIQEELNKIQEKFSGQELQNVVLAEYNKKCIESVLNEKESIIENIKDHNSNWLRWFENNQVDIEQQKTQFSNDLDVIYTNLKKIVDGRNAYIATLDITVKEKDTLINKLKSNISDITTEVNKSLNEQILQMSIKNEELTNLVAKDEDIIKDHEAIVKGLKEELKEVYVLLQKNNTGPIIKDIDYTSCNATLQKFISVNNMFFRKRKVISLLQGIINNQKTFNNLSVVVMNNIKNKFEDVKLEINKHIDFLDLNKYVNSPNIKFFKSNSTLKNIPVEFCEELNNISSYWDNNVAVFREQDRILTNLNEDLSGAVRVYVKIKPLLGIEQRNNTVHLEADSRKVTVDCLDVPSVKRKETFGEFYGIFNENFSNKDVYTGVVGTKDPADMMVDVDEVEGFSSTGLYSTFKQVEDGYSIVLFGYGDSGAGKTFSLLGEKGSPGLLHYGLANLKSVEKIKLKYMFEQYIDKFNPTINKMRGKLINLVREIPQLRKYSSDETKEFAAFLGSDINLNALQVDDITVLTTLIEKYRKNHSRIKKTPNNPVSSRSHLYMVYEITFESGKTGYITVVDTAGRERPIDIYNMFIDTSRRISLTTLLGPTGGVDVVKQHMKPEYASYDPQDVFEILNEGFYINETINHLIYFFNKKKYSATKVLSQTSLESYNSDKYYVNPRTEEDSISGANNCLMIPILKFLDVLSTKRQSEDDYKPTKYICIVCIRKDASSCSQVFGSLEFASRITSS